MQRQEAPVPIVTRNLVTQARHKREVFWQITIPLTVGITIVLAVAGLTAFSTTAGQKSQLADIALINMLIPALLFGALYLLMLAMIAYGVTRLIGVTPAFFFKIQNFFALFNFRLGRITDAMVEPFLRTRSFSASARAFRRNLFR